MVTTSFIINPLRYMAFAEDWDLDEAENDEATPGLDEEFDEFDTDEDD